MNKKIFLIVTIIIILGVGFVGAQLRWNKQVDITLDKSLSDDTKQKLEDVGFKSLLWNVEFCNENYIKINLETGKKRAESRILTMNGEDCSEETVRKKAEIAINQIIEYKIISIEQSSTNLNKNAFGGSIELK